MWFTRWWIISALLLKMAYWKEMEKEAAHTESDGSRPWMQSHQRCWRSPVVHLNFKDQDLFQWHHRLDLHGQRGKETMLPSGDHAVSRVWGVKWVLWIHHRASHSAPTTRLASLNVNTIMILLMQRIFTVHRIFQWKSTKGGIWTSWWEKVTPT